MNKPILVLDFDGVLHSYTSGWKGADVIPDPPVAGAMQFVADALEHFQVAILSSRSHQPGGREAMQTWLASHFRAVFGASEETAGRLARIDWPTEKPAAMITIDDRALTFDGTWPRIEDLLAFQPWNKRVLGATGTFPMPQLNEDDQGALNLGVARDPVNGLVHVNFGKPVAWFALPPEGAIGFAKLLLRHAGAKSISIEL